MQLLNDFCIKKTFSTHVHRRWQREAGGPLPSLDFHTGTDIVERGLIVLFSFFSVAPPPPPPFGRGLKGFFFVF